MIAALALCAALAAPARAAAAPAAAPATPAEEARRLYDSGRYAEAVEAYRRLVDASPRSAALRYDLGDALYKAGQTGRATASFERAFALDPRDRDVRHNLQYVLKRAGEDLVPPGTPPALFRAFTELSERELAGLQWLAAWAALLLAAAFLLAGPRRRALAPWAAGAGGAWLVFALWWAGLRSILPPDRGVIVAARAEVRHGPGESFGVAFTVPEGRRVRVLGADGGWLEVGVRKEGARGWIPAADVERL
jgi:tetratricopeptide (TPR) repeat protein